MTNKIELIEQRIQLKKKAEGILSAGEAEKRTLSADEKSLFEEVRSQIADIDKQISDIDKSLAEEKRQIENKSKEYTLDMKKINLTSEIRARIENPSLGNITVPAFESRDASQYSVTGDSGAKGGETVETVVEGLLTPLYDNQVLGNFTWLTGLQGDVKIPAMAGNTVGWEGEVTEADKTDSAITSVTLQPKRLSAYVDISKQLILQSNANIEAVIRQDLINALNDKLQKTFLGNEAGTSTKPAGLFYNASTIDAVSFANIVAIEQAAEEANVAPTGYIINPAIKADARQAVKAVGQGGFLFEGGELDGMPTAVTNAAKGVLFGNLKDFVIGQWGDVEVVVDQYTRATYGEIRLVINAYFDGKIRRADSIVAKTIAESSETPAPADPSLGE